MERLAHACLIGLRGLITASPTLPHHLQRYHTISNRSFHSFRCAICSASILRQAADQNSTMLLLKCSRRLACREEEANEHTVNQHTHREVSGNICTRMRREINKYEVLGCMRCSRRSAYLSTKYMRSSRNASAPRALACAREGGSEGGRECEREGEVGPAAGVELRLRCR